VILAGIRRVDRLTTKANATSRNPTSNAGLECRPGAEEFGASVAGRAGAGVGDAFGAWGAASERVPDSRNFRR
jgi:hypothetical protein